MSLEYPQYERFPLVVNVSLVHLSVKMNGSLKSEKGMESERRKKEQNEG
jgi:hypothetical protein